VECIFYTAVNNMALIARLFPAWKYSKLVQMVIDNSPISFDDIQRMCDEEFSSIALNEYLETLCRVGLIEKTAYPIQYFPTELCLDIANLAWNNQKILEQEAEDIESRENAAVEGAFIRRQLEFYGMLDSAGVKARQGREKNQKK
jgi:DNA-binding HxlR family transcriptional regulator